MTGPPEGPVHVPAAWLPDPSGVPSLRWWDGSRWTDYTARVATPTKLRRWKTFWIVIASMIGTIVVLAVVGTIVRVIQTQPSDATVTQVSVTAANNYTAYRITQAGSTSDSMMVPKGSRYKVYCHETAGNGADKGFFVKVDSDTVLYIHDRQVSSVPVSGYPVCDAWMSSEDSKRFFQNRKVYGVLATEP